MLEEKIEKLLEKSAKKAKTLQFAMNLPKQGFSYSYSSTVPNQRFHSASVGKLMTATLIYIAIEQGKLNLETKVITILGKDMLEGLFIFNGTDFAGEVTIKHLLGHLSGINDYFEGKTIDGPLFIDEVTSNTDTFWKPVDLVDFTRNKQRAIGRPGEKFLYSDTGYILLGLIIEAVYGMPFHEALEKFIFKPSGMDETQLCFYSEGFDQNKLAPLYINGVDAHLFKSLSCDFSGGGLSTTANDLLKFLDCLQNNEFFSQQLLDQMASFDNRYIQGLYYGYGIMQVRFEEFFFLLKNLPRLQGHIGVTGVHAWYDPVNKNTFVMNVGNTKDISKSFRLLIKILQLIKA